MFVFPSLRSTRSTKPSQTRRRVLGALLTLVVASSLAACGSDANSRDWELSDKTGPEGDAAWQQLVEDAKEEGEVVFYTAHAEDTMAKLAEAFEKEYGIEVKVFRAVDSDLEPKLDAENKSGNHVADIVGISDEAYLRTKSAAGEYAEPEGPALEEAGFDRETNTLAPGVVRSVATTMSYAWNTEFHADGLDDFDGLLDPSLSDGKIGVLSPFTPAVMDFYVYLEENYGADFVEELAKQDPRIYDSGAALAEALASGEIVAATQVSQVALYAAKEAGAPVDGGLADPAWAANLYEAVLTDAPHPNAAQLLLNYMFTPAGQEILGEHIATVLPDIPSAVTTADKTTTGGVMNAEPEVFDRFVARFNELFH